MIRTHDKIAVMKLIRAYAAIERLDGFGLRSALEESMDKSHSSDEKIVIDDAVDFIIRHAQDTSKSIQKMIADTKALRMNLEKGKTNILQNLQSSIDTGQANSRLMGLFAELSPRVSSDIDESKALLMTIERVLKSLVSSFMNEVNQFSSPLKGSDNMEKE